jgi:dipeptidyl-peptidase 4
MNRIFSTTLLFTLPIISFAQKKTFSFDEIFRGQYPSIFTQLPQIEGWVDDNHYIETRTDDNGKEITFSVDVLSGKTAPYIPPPSSETTPPEIEAAQNVTLSPDGKFAAFTRNNNLYIRELANKSETAVTSDGNDHILNGYASWIYYEEILGRSSHYKAFWWSPDSRHIAFMRFDDKDVPVFPIYFADGQHGYLEHERYPKAGDRNPDVKIGITSISDHKTVWADFNEKTDQYFGTPSWSPGNDLFVQWMNRGQDTLLVYNVNKNNGSKKQVYFETQPTWITLDEQNRFAFLTKSNQFIVKSDKDGWENLYLHDENGKQLSQVTSGNYWDTEVLQLDEKNNNVYFKARKENSARYDIYKASLNGKKVTRISSGDFSYDMANVSPNARYMIVMYSNLSTPPVMSIIDNKGKLIREIANSKTPAVDAFDIPKTILAHVRSSDNMFDLPLTISYPLNFDSTKKYPVWISVYGGPNSGTVYDRWKPAGGLTQWWAQEGVIQVVMDNRSSGHFGKKGMNYIFKKLGIWETEDYMTCAKWLRSQAWADTSKIGITGGSFGGYVTCMALTYGAGVFTHGIANYSVTDWQLYDTHYTERFMNTPKENPDGYKSTSVLTYANKLKGVLRIVHGSTDDNVHLQNSIQLIDALQDMGKSFELMIYPNQRHGIGNTKARHNLKETCRFIYRYMLKRELPKEFQ